MADPLSLTASVIAIATAAAHISRAISRMRGLKQMPAGVYALKNEVADLEVVLRQVGHALKQRTLVPDIDLEDLKKILTRTNDHLAELAKALERIAAACDGGEGIKAIGRFAVWWKEKGHFKTLKDEIRGARETLTMMLGASNSCVSFSPLSGCLPSRRCCELKNLTAISGVTSSISWSNSVV
jgi:hypothetical protein